MFIVDTFTRLFDNRPISLFPPENWDTSLRREWRETRAGVQRTDQDRLVETYLHTII